MDIDKDGRICYEDFETTVISNFKATWRKIWAIGSCWISRFTWILLIWYLNFWLEIKIEHEPLLLEAFGPCLPRAEALHKFFQQVHLDTFPFDQVCYVIPFCNFNAGDG